MNKILIIFYLKNVITFIFITPNECIMYTIIYIDILLYVNMLYTTNKFFMSFDRLNKYLYTK